VFNQSLLYKPWCLNKPYFKKPWCLNNPYFKKPWCLINPYFNKPWLKQCSPVFALNQVIQEKYTLFKYLTSSLLKTITGTYHKNIHKETQNDKKRQDYTQTDIKVNNQNKETRKNT